MGSELYQVIARQQHEIESLRGAKDKDDERSSIAVCSWDENGESDDVEATLGCLYKQVECQRVQLLQNECVLAQARSKRRELRKTMRTMEKQLVQLRVQHQETQQQRDQMEFQLRQAIDEIVLWQTRYEQHIQTKSQQNVAAESLRAMELDRQSQLIATQVLERTNESLRQQLEQTQQQLVETIESKETRVEQELAQWKTQLIKSETHVHELKSRVNALESQVLEKQMDMTLEQNAHTALKNQLRALQIATSNQLKERDTHINQLVLQLAGVQQALLSADVERFRVRDQLTHQRETLAMQQEEIMVWKNSALMARNIWKEWQEMLQELSKQHATQLKQYERLRVDHRREVAQAVHTKRQLQQAEEATQQIRCHAMQLTQVLKARQERDCRYGALLRETQAHNRRLRQAINQSKQQLKRVLGCNKEQKQCLDKQQHEKTELRSCFQSSIDGFQKKMEALATEKRMLESALDEMWRFCQECSSNEAKLRQELEKLEMNGQRELLVFG